MIIFLYGPDTYRIHEKIRGLKEKFVGKVDRSGINISFFDGERLKPEEFRKSAYSSGFLVEKRMIVIDNFISRGKNRELAEEIEKFADGPGQDDSGNVLVLVEKSEGRDAGFGKKLKASSLFKKISRGKYVQEFPLLSGKGLARWIVSETENRGGKISPGAVRALAAACGSDLWRMSGEIDKLTIYKKQGQITEEDTDLLVKSRAEDDIFGLVDAIGNKQKKKALALLDNQAASGSSWPYILSMLIRQFRILVLAKEAEGRGQDASQLARSAGLHPFVAGKALRQARNFRSEELKNIYRQLLEIDIAMKTDSVNPEALLDLLIARS